MSFLYSMVKKLNPSLVILDLMMPVMDGIETCQLIRQDIKIIYPKLRVRKR